MLKIIPHRPRRSGDRRVFFQIFVFCFFGIFRKKNQSQETFVNFLIYYILSKYIYFEKDLVRKDAPKKNIHKLKKNIILKNLFFLTR